MKYYIYHIPTFVRPDGLLGKIGLSKNPKKRVRMQGYIDYEILESYTNKATAAKREIELQLQYGYKKDLVSYDKVDYEQLGKKAAQRNKNQGKINASNGHMKKIQKLGCVLGGQSGGIKTKESGKLLEASKKGNQANIEKYGIKLIATNISTNEQTIFNSTGEAEKALSIPKVLIRKCLNGVQSKSKGYTFRKL